MGRVKGEISEEGTGTIGFDKLDGAVGEDVADVATSREGLTIPGKLIGIKIAFRVALSKTERIVEAAPVGMVFSGLSQMPFAE